MGEHEYRLRRAELLCKRETALKLGCKYVLQDCDRELKKLEADKNMMDKNSSRYLMPSMDDILEKDLQPSVMFLVTFENGAQMKMGSFFQPKTGLTKETLEKDFVAGFNRTQTHIKAISAHCLTVRRGAKIRFCLELDIDLSFRDCA